MQARKRNEPIFIFKQKAIAGISENQNAINEKFKNKINANAFVLFTAEQKFYAIIFLCAHSKVRFF